MSDGIFNVKGGECEDILDLIFIGYLGEYDEE